MRELEFELGREYTYRQICETLGWKVYTGGDSRKAQISAIESSYQFIHPVNPRTGKEKKSYVFIKKLMDIPEITHGGKRINAGKKPAFPTEYLQYLCEYMILQSATKENTFSFKGYKKVYFNSRTIFQSLGWPYRMNFLEGMFAVNGTLKMFERIVWKICHNHSTISLFKLYNGKFDGQLLFDRGILYFDEDGYKSNDELLPIYNEVEKQVYTELGFGSLGEAIANSSLFKVNRLVQQRFYEKRRLSDVTKVYRFLLPDGEFERIKHYEFDNKLIDERKAYFYKVILSTVQDMVISKNFGTGKYKFDLNGTQRHQFHHYNEKLKKLPVQSSKKNVEQPAEKIFDVQMDSDDSYPDFVF